MTQVIGCLLFDDFEELDLIGPWEVFGMSARLGADLETILVAPSLEPVHARYGLRILPDVTIADMPNLDVLLVPGGLGARMFASKHTPILQLIQTTIQHGWVVSVCTGALVLAAAGVLDGRHATTHFSSFDLLRQSENVLVVEDVRYLIEEPVATSAGVSAGVDLALALIERWYGTVLRNQVACQIEWPNN